MAPIKVLGQIKAEFRSRKGSKLNITKEKAVNILTEKCVNVRDCRASGKGVVSKTDCQAVESVDLIRQQESLDALSVDEQILRLIGEISDDENDSSFSSEISDDESDSSFISKIRYPDVDIFALCVRCRQKIVDLFGDDDLQIDAALRPGFPRKWQLVGIDVAAQHRLHEKLGAGSSGKLFRCLSQAKQLFSVDPFQLNDFETAWKSFDSSEVSGGISCYRLKFE